MTEAEILKAIADWMQEHSDITLDRVQMETSIADDLNLDSLDQVEITLALEEQFQVEIDDETAGKWKTIGDIVHYLVAHPVAADP